MTTKKTLLTFTETHETLSVRLNFRAQPPTIAVCCEQCVPAAPLLTLEDAVPIANLSVRALYRLVEDGLIHFKETPEGLLLVCLSNLDGRGPDAR